MRTDGSFSCCQGRNLLVGLMIFPTSALGRLRFHAISCLAFMWFAALWRSVISLVAFLVVGPSILAVGVLNYFGTISIFLRRSVVAFLLLGFEKWTFDEVHPEQKQMFSSSRPSDLPV
eukprot:scaffold2043_cov166-Amphora_coffeaeformis.AAC.30